MRDMATTRSLCFAMVFLAVILTANAWAEEMGVAEATYRRLSLTSLEYEGLPIEPGPIPTLLVRPGQPLLGSFSVIFEHDYAGSQVCPLAVTPNWGDRQTDYWQAADSMTNGGIYSSPFDLMAPDSLGLYYIIIASHNEYNAGQIVSA